MRKALEKIPYVMYRILSKKWVRDLKSGFWATISPLFVCTHQLHEAWCTGASSRMYSEDCSARPWIPSCRGANDAFNCTLFAFVLNKVNTSGPCLVSKILFPLEFWNKISGVFCLFVKDK